MWLISFIGTIFLFVLFFGLMIILFVVFFLRSKYLQLKRMAMGGKANDNVDVDTSTGSAQAHNPNYNTNNPQSKKIFQQDEGEYVDFEEIKQG